MKSVWAIVLTGVLISVNIYGQKNKDIKIKFGKITEADFTIVSPIVDSNANAVIISDIGSSEFVGNTKGWFSIVFKRHTRIKIVNKNAYDVATVQISLYSNGGGSEKLEDVKAATYNLENGQVVATSLERKDIFEEKQKRITRKKFTLPTLKPGSIIEYSYTIMSDFLFNLQPWEFQGEYPCLWSEYEVGFPDFFNYVFLTQGYIPLIKTEFERTQNFSVTDASNINARTSTLSSRVYYKKWAMRDIAALKEESFTSSIDNHIAKIEFQLSQYRFPNQPVQDIMENWDKVSKRMQESDDFGLAYTRANNWLDDEMKIITAGAAAPEEKMRKIYEYVRSNFKCTSTYGTRLSDQTSLKDVFKKKSGSVSDINLLLLAMMRHEGLSADPVLLSLRERGLVHPIYPLMDRFNYMICVGYLPSGDIYLDASKPFLGFGKLSTSCYNGIAWVFSSTPYSIALSADSLKENKRTSLFLFAQENGKMNGYVNSWFGNSESEILRRKIRESGMEAYSKELAKSFTDGITINGLEIDSLKNYDEPVSIKYNLEMKTDEDVIYFTPMLGDAMKKNPFSSAERNYPVEMPYTLDDTYTLNMEIPKGYVVDELPKSVRTSLNENEGLFEYIFSKSATQIMMRSRLVINKANFEPDDYQTLRDIFAFIIKKQSEPIVFKKAPL